MTSCKLLVYYPNDFKIFSGSLISAGPLTAELHSFTEEELDGAVCIKLKWYEGVTTHLSVVKLENVDKSTLVLSETTERISSKDDNHFIEFKDIFEIIKVSSDDAGNMRYKVDKLNNRFRSTLANQIKKIITDESLTNQYILKMLMKIDSKMDELLDTLKNDDHIEGIKERNMLGLGGSGMSFVYNDMDVEKGDIIYVQSLPKNGSGMNFAALCTVSDTICYPGGCICEADFSYIDESTRESVIHFIFQKERENLKRYKS